MGFVGLSGCFVFLSCSGLNAELVNFPSYRIEIIAVQLLFLKIAITESPIFIGPQAFNNLLMISASFEGEELEFFIACEVQVSVCISSLILPWQLCSQCKERGSAWSPLRWLFPCLGTQLSPQYPAGRVWSVLARRQGHRRDMGSMAVYLTCCSITTAHRAG